MESTDNLHNFAIRLKTTLKRKGYTLDRIASEIGVSKSAVGAWTQGKNYPEVEIQKKLASILGESVEWLIHGIPAPPYGQAEHLVMEPQDSYRHETALRSEPSDVDIRHYIEDYLQEAKQVPGGIARTWLQLHLHLPLEEIRKLRRQLANRG